MEKVCEGEDLGVANGRISPSRSPFLATAEKKNFKGCGCLRLRGGGLSGGSFRGYGVGLYPLLCI